MRVEGMDAVGMAYNKSPNVSTESKEFGNDTKDVKEIKDIKSISHLTNIEKMELPISEKVVIEAIEKANKAISGTYRRFEFAIHEKTKQIMVKVIECETNEVIREIPPEKVLDLVATIWENIGILVDERR